MSHRIKRPFAISTAAMLALSSCAVDETPTAGPRSIAVQPRVVVDGMVELGARADRIVVDEVLFHAPSVVQGQDDLLDGSGPLLFRYDASSRDGFGDVLGGERRWTIDASGALAFTFRPLGSALPAVEALELETGVDLQGLVGHTATVSGYLLMSTGGSSTGFACDGDPDGNPSLCGGADDATRDGDPDGNPSRTSNSADGDPDGNPSEVDPAAGPQEHKEGLSRSTSNRQRPRAHDSRVARHRVPFALVMSRTFALRVPVDELLQRALSEDEVLPIDLHVQLDDLISDELLALLDEEATDEEPGAIVVEVPGGVHVGIDVDTDGVRRVARETVRGGIRVVGDAR